MIDQLYGEIREAQKYRVDLLKWKIILVSALAAVGLGFTKSSGSNEVIEPKLILCVIPFACAYVDVLHRHLLIRGKVNGEYLKHTDSAREFEAVFREISTDVVSGFNFESLLIISSSVVFSTGVVSIGLWGLAPNWPLVCTGLVGVILAVGIHVVTRKKQKQISTEMGPAVAKVRDEVDNIDQARVLIERAHAIFLQRLGPDHLKTKDCAAWLSEHGGLS